ncbi:MAG: gliding motility protein GldL [Bacteroidales bacterium]|jgi:gliding motility-associated protein GldL|nr:gliding motility protein GldL [Bacteroidales bacterium]
MSIDSIVRSKTYKNLTAKLYGIGAAVVIMGALFKINHYPGADYMLIIGMGIESIIFFVSAFEPLHVEFDWSLVYPELAGMNMEEEAKKKRDAKDKKKTGDAVQELDKMLENAKIGPELIDSLGKGLQNLSVTANQLGNVASAAVASEQFAENMTQASDAVAEVSAAYRKTAENLSKDLLVSGDYLNAVQDATNAVGTLANIYKETANALSSGDVSYLDELKTMAASLSSINALYEMQIQNSSSQLEATKLVQERIDNLVSNFADTAENVLRYKEQVNALSKKVGALNDIYGNMLAAMQVKA